MANVYNNILRAGTQASYNALETKDASVLYFCTDTGKLYKGSVDFTDSMVTAATRPATPIAGKIYFLADTNTVEVYVSGAWKVISYPTVATVNESSDNVHLATAKAVYDAIQKAVKDLAGSTDVVKEIANGTNDAELKVVMGDDSESTVTVKGVVTTPTWDSTARKLTLPVAGLDAPVEVNIGKDIFIDPEAENGYNAETNCIDIYLNDGTPSTDHTKISIPVAGLVDIYTGANTDSATVTVTEDKKINVAVNVDTDANNAITVSSAGLKVDLSAYATTAYVNGEVAKLTTAVEAAQDDATDALGQLTTLNAGTETEGSVDYKVAALKSEIKVITDELDTRVGDLETRMTATEKATADNTANIAALATAVTTWGSF